MNKEEIVEEILTHTPYLESSAKYPQLFKDLMKLSLDTLFILKSSIQQKEEK